MPMPAARLDVESLSAGYGPTQIIADISFDVPAGDRLAILGRNGMGKTTLLATLMGLSTRHRGQIRIDGNDLAELRPSSRSLRGVGYVPQTRGIFRSLTVEENLSTGLKGRPRSALAEAYEMFPRLGERRRHLGLQLSGGEQQMLSMARILRTGARLLLLDEITEGLAPVIVKKLGEVLTSLKSRGFTIVLVEQNFRFAAPLADRHYVLEHGRIVQTVTREELPSSTQRLHALLGV